MNKEAILEGLLFVVGDEGITLDNITEVLEVDKKKKLKSFLKIYKMNTIRKIEVLE